MKKYLLIIIALVLIVNHSPGYTLHSKPKPVVLKIKKNCDDGFGLCLVFYLRTFESDIYNVEAEAEYKEGKLALLILKDKLSPELLRQFDEYSSLPVDNEIQLSDEVVDQLNLPPGSVLAEGTYEINKDPDFFQVTIPVVK